jgi:hypothetical protein
MDCQAGENAGIVMSMAHTLIAGMALTLQASLRPVVRACSEVHQSQPGIK